MSSSVLFCDRNSAGEQLAEAIEVQIDRIRQQGILASPIVYALPRGGLPIAVPIAQRLGCPLDIIVAKKITLPQDPELAIGAVTANGHAIWSNRLRLPQNHPDLQQALQQAQQKAQQQYDRLSVYCPKVSPQGAIAIIIDDGIATGMTVAVAVQALQAQKPDQVWIGTPVAPLLAIEFLHQLCDRAIVLATPSHFLSVSRFYQEFTQVELEVAATLLQKINQPPTEGNGSAGATYF